MSFAEDMIKMEREEAEKEKTKETAQAMVNEAIKDYFESGSDEELDLDDIYDKLFELGFSSWSAICIIDEAIYEYGK